MKEIEHNALRHFLGEGYKDMFIPDMVEALRVIGFEFPEKVTLRIVFDKVIEKYERQKRQEAP